MKYARRERLDEHVIKLIIACSKELGYKPAKIVLKSDQESSVKSVIIRDRRAEESGDMGKDSKTAYES